MCVGHYDDVDLDFLTPGWQTAVHDEDAPEQTGAKIGKADSQMGEAAQQSLGAVPADLAGSAKPRYTLRSHQEQASDRLAEQEDDKHTLESAPKSLRIKGMQSNGFLIPMQQPLSTAQGPMRSLSMSDKGASSEAPSLRENSPARQSSGSVQPVSSSELRRGPSNDGTLHQEGRGGSLASQTSELVRVVTSGSLPEPKLGAESQGKASEGKRRRKTEGLPTSRVTRSAMKKQQEAPKRGQAQAQEENTFDAEHPQGLPDFRQRLSNVVDSGIDAAAATPSTLHQDGFQVVII